MSPPHTFVSEVSDDVLDRFYSIPNSIGAPFLPGPTHESALALLEVLRHDFRNHHTYVNDLGFHNHSSHHVLAIYALGASPELIKYAYRTHLPKLLPVLVSPESITEKNFTEHLGDEKYYDAYLAFFMDYLQDNSPTEALEHFIFSPLYNYVPDLQPDGPCFRNHPHMLNRLLAGVAHPFIHLAYGFEFGILGQVAEGLAQVAVHKPDQIELIPPSYFTKSELLDGDNNLVSDILSALSLSQSSKNHTLASERRPTFAFHRRIRDDPAFKIEIPDNHQQWFPAAMKQVGNAIFCLVQEWTKEWLSGAHSSVDTELRLKGMIEEVIWGNAIWYGVGGWVSRGDDGRATNADFFLAHLVTSSIFLPRFLLKEEASSTSSAFNPGGALPFANRLLLLQTYLSMATAWKIIRGDHALPIVDFYTATDAQMFAPIRAGPRALPSPFSSWTRIIASGLQSPDEHTPKLVRALADFAVRWGTRAAGYYSTGKNDSGTDGCWRPLEGIERLDGTLFVRIAGITLERLGWVHESEGARHWDRDGFTL